MSSGGHGKAQDPERDELDPDEPRTPMWLPLLGLCLFFAAAVYVLTRSEPPAEPTSEAAASAAPAPSAAPAAPAPAPAPPH